MIRKIAIISLASIVLVGCNENWTCKVDGKTMYSISDSGEIGSADKGCTCEQIRQFEYNQFGEVDEEALRSDFGC